MYNDDWIVNVENGKSEEMVIYCFVPQCTTIGTNGLHRYPTDPERRKKWMDNTKTTHLRSDENNAKVCSKHFKESDRYIDIDGKKRIFPHAVPTLCLPGPLILNWEHSYALVSTETLPKNRPFKRLKCLNQEAVSNDDVGNEVEIGRADAEKQVSLGQYLSIDYVKSLEDKILKMTKDKLELSRKLRNTTRQLKRLQQKPKRSELNDDKVIEYLRDEKKYSNEHLELQKMQMRNTGRKPHARRYTPKEKSLCLAMYKAGPRSYRFKDDIMLLPTLSTLGRHNSNVIFPSGICPTLFSFMKEKVKNWSKEDLCCSFSFDETALKSRIEYSSTMDEITGFVEMAGIVKPIFATHALTFMVRGINVPFKQPVAHYYTHGIKTDELAGLVELVLGTVLSTGLDVIMSVCDQVPTNESTINRLMQRDFKTTPGCLLKYKVLGKTVLHCWDASHWVKVVRNNFEVKDLSHCIEERFDVSCPKTTGKRKVASWEDVKNLYELDRTGCHRFLPKITEQHIKPTKLKMKVCNATQVFSRTYGEVMLHCAEEKKIPAKSCDTAQFLLFINDLFDSFNGSGPVQFKSLKGSIDENSKHFVFWEYALVMLSKMNFVDKITGNINSRSTVLYRIMSTIRGYQEVTRICFNMNIKEVSLRNTDSDGLENFFSCVKSYCQISCQPTPRQFRSGYTTVIFNNLTSAKSISSNCEQDTSFALLNDIHELISQRNNKANTESINLQANDLYLDVICDPETTTQELNFFETESLKYTSSVICSKMVKRNPCKNCQPTLQASELNVPKIIGQNENDPKSTYPSENFMKIFERVFAFTLQIIPSFVSEKSIKKILIEEVKKRYKEEVEAKTIIALTAIGCVEHNPQVVNNLFELTIDKTLNVFCKNINDLLTGKILSLPPKPNAIQELAQSFWHKKTIRKHSDIFKTS